jgi:hypothetical protein
MAAKISSVWQRGFAHHRDEEVAQLLAPQSDARPKSSHGFTLA